MGSCCGRSSLLPVAKLSLLSAIFGACKPLVDCVSLSAAVATCPHGSVREWAGCPMVSTASDGWSGCCTTLLDAKTRGIALLTRSSTACKPVLRFTDVCSVLVRPRTSVFGCPNASHFTQTLAWMLSKVPRVKNSLCTIFELTRRIVRNN